MCVMSALVELEVMNLGGGKDGTGGSWFSGHLNLLTQSEFLSFLSS